MKFLIFIQLLIVYFNSYDMKGKVFEEKSNYFIFLSNYHEFIDN